MSYAPLWSVTLGRRYRHPITDGWDGFANVDAKYTSSYQVGSDEDPVKMQHGFALVNGSIGISTHDQRLTLSIWGTQPVQPVLQADRPTTGCCRPSRTPPAANPGENNYYYFPARRGSTARP